MVRFVFVLLVFVLWVRPVYAGNYCHIDTALGAYNAALQRKNIGDHEGALSALISLSKLGMAPAQRHLAQYYLKESRDPFALEKAAKWAQLSAWGGDRAGLDMVKEFASSLRHSIGNKAFAQAKEWRPVKSVCPQPLKIENRDDDLKIVLQFPLFRGQGIGDEVFWDFGERLGKSLRLVGQVAPQFSPLVDLIPAFEVVQSKTTERFIFWNDDTARLEISRGYLNDLKNRQLAYGLVLAVQRMIYARIKDGFFLDPIALEVGNVSLYGSLYGDVKTKRFLSMFQEALKGASTLPVALRDQIYSLDQIYYMPPSRYHKKRMNSQRGFALYDHERSSPRKRIAVVYQRMNFKNADDILLELVQLGTFAQHHAMIEGFRQSIEGKGREDQILQALEGKGLSAAHLFNQGMVNKKQRIEAWDKAGPKGDKKLVCTAALAQVKAAIILKIQATSMSKRLKIHTCVKARQAWEKHRSLKK